MYNDNQYLPDDIDRPAVVDALWNLLYVLLSIAALLAFLWFIWAYAATQRPAKEDMGIELQVTNEEITKDTDCDDAYESDSSLSSYRCSSISSA